MEAGSHLLQILVGGEEGQVVAAVLADEGSDGFGHLVKALAPSLIRGIEMVGQQELEVLGGEGGFQVEQGVALFAAQHLPEVVEWGEGGREEDRRDAAPQGLAQLGRWVHAEEFEAEVFQVGLGVGGVVGPKEIGDALEAQHLEVEFDQLLAVRGVQVADEHLLGLFEKSGQQRHQVVG